MQKIDSQIKKDCKAGNLELSMCGRFNQMHRRIRSKHRRQGVKKLTEKSYPEYDNKEV